MSLPISVKNGKLEQFYIFEPFPVSFLFDIGMTERPEPYPDVSRNFREFIAYDYLSEENQLEGLPFSFSIVLGSRKSDKVSITLFTQNNIKDEKIKEAQDSLINKLKGYERVKAGHS